MPKFIIEETLVCYVTWRRTVEADTEELALEAFDNGDGEAAPGYPEIGDQLDHYPALTNVIE